jgi:hypothetical protein
MATWEGMEAAAEAADDHKAVTEMAEKMAQMGLTESPGMGEQVKVLVPESLIRYLTLIQTAG